jgi:hypothetical protein
MTDDELSSQHRDPREGLAVDGLLSATIEGWRLIYVENYEPWSALRGDGEMIDPEVPC